MGKIYHASSVKDINVLRIDKAHDEDKKIYFSRKRENVLVYLSNAVEKCCKSQGFKHDGNYKTWGPYGFSNDGRLQLDEYYPNATLDTYSGVGAYIYTAIESDDMHSTYIKDALYSTSDVEVVECEYIPDAYQAIMTAINDGKILLRRYEELSQGMLDWIEKTTKDEYKNASPDYKFFLKCKFDNILKDCE